MKTTERKNELHKDADLIYSIGITRLANRLGYSPQRIFNWTVRGVPARELLNNKNKFRK